jgi:hypothetical protein
MEEPMARTRKVTLRSEPIEGRRQRLAAEWQTAARDPLFLKDIEEVELAFRSADAETARDVASTPLDRVGDATGQ